MTIFNFFLDVPSPYAWTHSPFAAAVSPFSPLPLSPFPMTSLLSPTASHPSSLSSSREDVQNAVEREMIKRRLLPASAGGHFDAPPASPLWSFGGTPIPTPVWQCFQVKSLTLSKAEGRSEACESMFEPLQSGFFLPFFFL